MKYFYKTDDKGNVFISNGHIIPNGYIEFKLKEDGSYPKEVEDVLALEKLKFEKSKEYIKAKQYLQETDYKVLPDYDGNTEGILEARAEARELIRGLEG